MRRIDRETVQRILDAADIVEVVSDFVSLKKRGANYIGLCPFHNERTPSFSVSKAKGICKCFSCGKGGSPVNFIMEHENMTYNEALRYLAKKYNIEIREHEVTDAEREEATEREAMLAVNDFAAEHFQHNLTDTDDGRDIGLSYFRHRGINDQMIQRFGLGYAMEKSDTLLNAAKAKGYTEEVLVKTGLCSRSERGSVYDRFRGRVIYPVYSVSGRIVAFGGRTLRSDKQVAKYVNSPESAIYRKSYELYGLYQAKGAIKRKDKCILVEGYMDVISMHQAGIENVVASSGTSLTEGQIRLIHRFTDNVTVIYDSDPAGIKASLRGIDMLLAEGLNIKVMLLPDGDDPDSFAQSHSATEVEQYLQDNETDFISFKTRILLADAGNDPIKRASVINDIVKSIAVIPDAIVRALYLSECSRMLGIDEKVLSLQMTKAQAENSDKLQREAVAQQARAAEEKKKQQAAEKQQASGTALKIRMHERVLAKYIVKYGLLPIAQAVQNEGDDNPEAAPDISVLDFIHSELEGDEIRFTDPVVAQIMDDALQAASTQWPSDFAQFQAKALEKRNADLRRGEDDIRLNARDLADIEVRESEMRQKVQSECDAAIENFTMRYLEDMFLSSPNDEVRILATDLAEEKYQLSKVHTKYAHVETERERLADLVERGVWELKFAILDQQIEDMNKQIRQIGNSNPAQTQQLMAEIFELYQLKSQFAKALGDRIVNPK